MKLYIQVGRSTKVLGNVKIPPPLNFTFNWLGKQRYLGNIKINIQLLMMMMMVMMMKVMMMVVMMMMMRCPSSLRFGSKPRHLPHRYIYISTYLSTYLPIYLSIYLSIYILLHIYIFIAHIATTNHTGDPHWLRPCFPYPLSCSPSRP